MLNPECANCLTGMKKPWAFPTTLDVFFGPSVKTRWKIKAPASGGGATVRGFGRAAVCGCWMYKDNATNGFEDEFECGNGETVASCITTSIASVTAPQNTKTLEIMMYDL